MPSPGQPWEGSRGSRAKPEADIQLLSRKEVEVSIALEEVSEMKITATRKAPVARLTILTRVPGLETLETFEWNCTQIEGRVDRL
jgi:hypothetical protein